MPDMITIFKGTQCGYETLIEVDGDGCVYVEQAAFEGQALAEGEYDKLILEADTLRSLFGPQESDECASH